MISGVTKLHGKQFRASSMGAVRPEYKDDLHYLLKETYNYLKHAIRDHDRSIVASAASRADGHEER
jgi:hypothetical protein